MVVEYVSGAEGSCLSFLTQTPRMIFKCRGSAIPLVFPQLCLAVGLSALAQYLQDSGQNPFSSVEQPVSLGILVSFLLIFKTQNAYGQFWQALEALDNLLHTSRTLALATCTMFDWDKPDDVEKEVQSRSRRILRLIVLHYFVIVEYFQRSGANSTSDKKACDMLRDDIRHLTGAGEFAMLYPGDRADTPGHQSKHETANPVQALFWIQLAAGRVLARGACPPPIMNGFIGHLHNLSREFGNMNRIDKTQFPFPYAQIVKILVIVWVFTLPFFIVAKSGLWTSVITCLASLGFFGLDEVAEILESPFGNDPNDIFLRHYGAKLMNDFELMYNGRDTKLDDVFSAEKPMNFSELLQGRFHMDEIKRNSSGEIPSEAKQAWNRFDPVEPVSPASPASA